MSIFKKIILGGILFVLVGLPAAALAADPPPAMNSLCWKQKECSQTRASLGADKPNEGWVKDIQPCKGGEGENAWGMCLPPIKTVTEISFGGSTNFENIGVFILTIYKYAVGVASILATVMIIIAGAQWAVSGGNAETINNSKKRIVGAIVGLFIALMSNFILNSINPALVNLRLPQVWMVKKQSLLAEFCTDIQDKSLKFAQAADSTEQAKQLSAPPAGLKFDQNPFTTSTKASFYCGKRFYAENAGSQTCWGDYCETGKLCVKNETTYECWPAIVAGKISGGRSDTPIDTSADSLPLMFMCNNDKGKAFLSLQDGSQTFKTAYAVKGDPAAAASDAISKCGGASNVAGFFLGAFLKDCAVAVPGFACIGPAADDWFAIGRTPGSNVCDVNLALQAFSIKGAQAPSCSSNPGYMICSCAFATSKGFINIMSKDATFQTYLISLDEIKKGFRCNISMDDSQFPGLPNGEKELSFGAVKSILGPIAGFQIETLAEITRGPQHTDCNVTK